MQRQARRPAQGRQRGERGWSGYLAGAGLLTLYALVVVLTAVYLPSTHPLWARPGVSAALRAALRAALIVVAVAGVGVGLWRLRGRWLVRVAGLAVTAFAAFGLVLLAASDAAPTVLILEQLRLAAFAGFATLVAGLYRQGKSDLALYIQALAATVTLALVVETLEWLLVPGQGSLAGVGLAALAGLVGLLFMALVVEAGTIERPAAPRRRAGALSALALVVVAAAFFVQLAHFGYLIEEPRIGVFVSRFTADRLASLSSQWRPPAAPRGATWRQAWQTGDYYPVEARWHLEVRNADLAEGRPIEALKRQWILETFFASYLGVHPEEDLLDDERARVIDEAGADVEAYPFDGGPHDLVATIPRPILWLVTGLVATLLIMVAELIKLRK